MSVETLASREVTTNHDQIAGVIPASEVTLALYGDTPLFASVVIEHDDANVLIPYPRPSSENTAPTTEIRPSYPGAPEEDTPLFYASMAPFLDIRERDLKDDVQVFEKLAKTLANEGAQHDFVQRLLDDVDYTAHTPPAEKTPAAPRVELLSRTSVWGIEDPDFPALPEPTRIKDWPIHTKGFGIAMTNRYERPVPQAFSPLRVLKQHIARGWRKLFPPKPKRLPL